MMSPFVLADAARAEQFLLIGRGDCLRDGTISVDGDGVGWRVTRIGIHVAGFTWLASGWAFDEYARQRHSDRLQERRTTVRNATTEQHSAELAKTLHALRLGAFAERLLWTIHQHVLTFRTSVIMLPDRLLAQRLWGSDHRAWPRHWRGEILAILNGLTWLHLATSTTSSGPQFGDSTALLTHVAIRESQPGTPCPSTCPEPGARRHNHFLINVGRGFLGVLEDFVKSEAGGIRRFVFPVHGKRGAERTSLRRVGKSGRLVTIYLPAKVGDTYVCKSFSARQHRLLQSIVRETTRQKAAERNSVSDSAMLIGNAIPSINGKETIVCPFLAAEGRYAGFNGNKRLKGRGYKLLTPGGWLAKAGYVDPDGIEGDRFKQTRQFLDDLSVLCRELGLTAVGIMPPRNEVHSLGDLQDFAIDKPRRLRLDQVHLRIYTSADYVTRWNSYFSSDAPSDDQRADDPGADISSALRHRGMTQRQLALAIQADGSFLSKVLRGLKPWPAPLARKAREWLASSTTTSEPPTLQTEAVLSIAMEYLERGWFVIPQVTGAKKPCVRWKHRHHRNPTRQELERWLRKWPHAGLAVVLGHVSNLFVIDVDGPAAHAVLLEHLGSECLAPRVNSGSQQPHRYHLFFSHPPIPTKAKDTPWHPKLEFRGEKGIVILPPSLHKSGRCYAWAPGRSLADMPLTTVPAAVLEALSDAKRERGHRGASDRGTQPSEVVSLKDVAGLEVSASTQRFLSGEFVNGPRWNERLFAAACDMAGRKIPIEIAEPLLIKGAGPWDDGELAAARRTIQSAYQHPRTPGRH